MANPREGVLPPAKKQGNTLPTRQKKQVQRLRSGIDWFFLGIVLVLLTLGTIFIYSASYVYAKQNYSNSYFFISKQLGWVIFALIGLFLIVRFIDYLILKKLAYLGFFVSYALLILVYFIGEERNGAKRWLDFKLFDLQPSEIVKFMVILVIATYVVWLDNKGKDLIRTVRHGIVPFGILAVAVAIPLLLQPHLSATIIILGLIFIMMFLSGVKKRYLVGAILVGGTLMMIIILFTSHGQARIDNWFHPENDIQGAGWQPLQSLYAIGSGGLWGVGFGASKQKHLYLPEPQNDYIFAVICEEMGFVFA
ncbi:MAG: FtsW/RodA/SpoVE family cell cycle protein, partial [Clostridia bacterium]|nr:FtsW/RodA/SpoVE family cell cycle protein [Clostridia bacterium]